MDFLEIDSDGLSILSKSQDGGSGDTEFTLSFAELKDLFHRGVIFRELLNDNEVCCNIVAGTKNIKEST